MRHWPKYAGETFGHFPVACLAAFDLVGKITFFALVPGYKREILATVANGIQPR